MYDAILGMFGQSAEQAARRDMDDYTTSGGGGLKPREGLEVLGDILRGGSGAVNKAAKELYVEGLKNKYGDAIEDYTGAPAEITATTGEGKLRRQTRDAKRVYERDQRTADYKTDPLRIEQEGIRKDALLYQQGRDKETDRRFDLSEARNTRLEQDRIAERKEGRLDRIDQRMSDREVRMLELGQQERMFDKRLQSDARADKKQRMAAIIAGLANLGGAFAI